MSEAFRGHVLTKKQGDMNILETHVEHASDPTITDPGRLHLGAQTKSSYRSPSFFATLGREVSTCVLFIMTTVQLTL